MSGPNGKDSGAHLGKEKVKKLEIPDRDISIIQQGSDNLLIVISKKAMKMMQAGCSYPLEMTKGDRMIKFVIIEKETFDKQAMIYAEKVLKERAKEIEGIGEGLVNEKVDPGQTKKGN